jgi:hypothetical protein
MAAGDLHAIGFTGPDQIHQMFDVARAHGTELELRAALSRLDVTALNGPVAACLRRFGVRVDSTLARPSAIRELTQRMTERLARPAP